jgi:vancomycin resistance protein YoaR
MQSTTSVAHRRPIMLRRGPADFAALFVLLVIFTAIIAGSLWNFWHTERIYTGVTVSGISIGGQTRAEALQRLTRQLPTWPLPPVQLEGAGRSFPLQSTHVRASADLTAAVNQAYQIGRSPELVPNLLSQARTVLFGNEITPPLRFDHAQLRAGIETIAAALARPARPARIIGDTTIPAQVGLVVDVDATLQNVMARLTQTDFAAQVNAPLVVTEVQAQQLVAAPDGVSARTRLPAPLLLRSEALGIEFALDPVTLVALQPGESGALDVSALRGWLEELALQIDRPARDARLRWDFVNGGARVVQASTPGLRLDVEATLLAVQEALTVNGDSANLVVERVLPAVDSNRVAEMGIQELVASGTTYYAGSSASRVRNVEVAAALLEGVVIPPGGVFSFNDNVKDVSSANGFEDSLVIWGDRTAVGVGGGVCQVSTTVFRAAYEGGFPIVERYNHGYVVSWYGEPGLDATIFTPTVDFRFRNDTGAFLLLEPVVDSANGVITINLYGTSPNRTVTLSQPEITKVIQPEPPAYVVDETLAPGAQEQVEWEKEGMTVSVTRSIVENGESRTDTLVSEYTPWKAVYLVGPGTDIPATETPIATPAP